MDTWETGSFDNDDARDWLGELSDSSDLGLIAQALDPHEVQGYYLEAPDCVRILCAGEILAALRGQPASSLPDEAREWLEAHAGLDPSPHLQRAIQGGPGPSRTQRTE